MTRIYIGLMGVYLNYHVHKNYKDKKNFKGTWKPIQTMMTTRLNLILNTKHESQRQEYEVCKTKVQTRCYFDNIRKLEYEMKWIYDVRSYVKLMLNKLKVMVGPTFIYILLRT
jgi:hypothetical protein